MKKFTLLIMLIVAVSSMSFVCAFDDSQNIGGNDSVIENVGGRGDWGYYDKLTLHVDDVTQGEPIIVDVQTSDFISGWPIQIVLSGTSYRNPFFYTLINQGHAQISIDSSNLAPGTYTVEVFDNDHSGLQPLEPDTVTFTIKPKA